MEPLSGTFMLNLSLEPYMWSLRTFKLGKEPICSLLFHPLLLVSFSNLFKQYLLQTVWPLQPYKEVDAKQHLRNTRVTFLFSVLMSCNSCSDCFHLLLSCSASPSTSCYLLAPAATTYPALHQPKKRSLEKLALQKSVCFP